MDTPGYDPVSATGQVAGGANMICFTTGRGSAYGCKPAPSLKLATNTPLFVHQEDDMDFNCGTIIDGTETHRAGGRALLPADSRDRLRPQDEERGIRLRRRRVRAVDARRDDVMNLAESPSRTALAWGAGLRAYAVVFAVGLGRRDGLDRAAGPPRRAPASAGHRRERLHGAGRVRRRQAAVARQHLGRGAQLHPHSRGRGARRDGLRRFERARSMVAAGILGGSLAAAMHAPRPARARRSTSRPSRSRTGPLPSPKTPWCRSACGSPWCIPSSFSSWWPCALSAPCCSRASSGGVFAD